MNIEIIANMSRRKQANPAKLGENICKISKFLEFFILTFVAHFIKKKPKYSFRNICPLETATRAYAYIPINIYMCTYVAYLCVCNLEVYILYE